MPPLQIKTVVVQHALVSLKPHQGQGPDSLHPAVPKSIAPIISQPLTDMLNLFLVSAEVPDNWRSAIVLNNKRTRQFFINCNIVLYA